MKLLKVLLVASILTFANAQLTRHSDNIVKDNKSNLLWQDSRDVKTKKVNYKEALAYCKNLTLDGQKGWMVPGFGELFTIVNFKRYNPTLSKEFKNFLPENYWTTKVFSHGISNEAFVVYFLSGAFNREKMDKKFFVRCYKKL